MAHALLTVELQLELPSPHRVVGGVVREALSQRTHATLEVASVHDLDFRPLLGEEAVLRIGGLEDRQWTLRLGRAELLGDENGSYRYRLDLYDALWLLGFSRNTRKFRNQSAKEIVLRVLAEQGIDQSWLIGEEPPVRKFCAQYEETNLAFVERLLESEGIYYGFDQQGTVLLSDDSRTAPQLQQAVPYGLIAPGSALDHGDSGIFELFRCARVQSGGTTLGDYSWKTPKVLLRESAFDDVDADLERYSYPAGFRKPEQGERLAKMRLEALRADARTLEGKASVPRFQPGVGFVFGTSVGEQFAGEYVLLRVEHSFLHHELKPILPELAEAESYGNRFRAIPRATRFRPEVRTPRPTVNGSHTAMVRGPTGEEIHTDEHGRFRAQLHWDREAVGTDEDSRWLRKMQEVSTGMTLARTGWEMYVAYIDGDPDRPIGLGRAINGEMIPSYSLPANKTVMSMKTPSSPATGGFNELRLDDSAGSQMFYLQAEKDYDGLVKRNLDIAIDNDEVHTVGIDFERQITGNQSVTVGANATATYGANHKVNIQGSSGTQVGGSVQVKIGGGSTIRIDCSDSETVGGLRLTVAGSFSPPDLAALAKSAAEQFVRTAAPGAASLYDKAKQLQSLPETIKGLPDLALGKAKGYIDGLKSWPADYAKEAGEEVGSEAWDAFEEAFKAAFESKKDDDPVQGAVDGVKAGAGAAIDSAWDKIQSLPDSAKDSALEQLQGIADDIKGMLPTQKDIQGHIDGLQNDFKSLMPTDASLQQAAKEALSTMTGGISDSLLAENYDLALEQFLTKFFSGGIKRSAQYLSLKVVGGAYVTASVLDTEWTVGKLYAETVGGVKLTAALEDIAQSVDGLQTVTVGGAMMRMAGASIDISAATSAVTVGATASLESGGVASIKSVAVTLEAGSGLLLQGSGAKAQLSPGSISLTGELKLDAAGSITVSGGKAEVT